MIRRAASPAPSEPELDIFDSLDPGEEDNRSHQNANRGGSEHVDFDDILNDSRAVEDGGDEAFIALQQAASYRKASHLKGRTVKKGGGFQAMGLNANLLKAITRKGFSVPTPIQRKTIPLVLDRKDVVGMARTGSGKTGAFVIPMIEKLRAHDVRFGSRALIMSPSRELAIQTLKVVKEFARGTDLRAVLLVGGDNLEEQFGFMASNPDIVIATPGRFLHLKVEMSLDLSSMQYVVFDEADRLFEMGFAAQLTEILHALPPSRQTLLFSATLPASLVDFARAGLQEPSLVRLDAETKVSPDLESAFFSVKGAEREGSLLHILHDVIKVPLGPPEQQRPTIGSAQASKKRKRGAESGAGRPTQHSTIIFTATKHHVEYLASMLRSAGFAVSHVYGSLDQTARRNQVEDFRQGRTHLLVVTDVAARGIDIPILANVINYDFPSQPKIFVHRVGRTARAGHRGWSYSLVRDSDAPYLLDLQLFLGRRLVLGQQGAEPSFASDVVVGALKRDMVEANVEWTNKLLREDSDISALRSVATKAEKLYLKTRNSASSQSAKRAKEIVSSTDWGQLHRLFGQDVDGMEQARADMLARISGFKPSETIFEVGRNDKSHSEAAEVMKQLRSKITPKSRQPQDRDNVTGDQNHIHDYNHNHGGDDVTISTSKKKGSRSAGSGESSDVDEETAGVQQTRHDDDDDDDDNWADDLEVIVSNTTSRSRNKGTKDWRDSEVFMSYTPRTTSTAEERGYGVHSGGFVEAARTATMDLTNDESAKSFGQPARSKMRWDARSKKYVSRENDDDGSKGSKMIIGESGVRIAATFQSGRYDKWKRDQRSRGLPRVGETEKPKLASLGAAGGAASLASGPGSGGGGGGVRYKHTQQKAPKEADKYRDDFHVRKKRVAEAREKRMGRFKDGMGSKKELKDAHDIRKAREDKERRRAKNGRPRHMRTKR